ncbi:MAG: beta galactosidase jelly roll domain-containing protein [Cyclobacteriaceae bacterium]
MMNRLLLVLTFLLGSLDFCTAQNTLSLDGQWEIIFDENNNGRTAKWFLDSAFKQQASIQKIKVPSAWELIKEDYEGVAFYRTKFSVPKNWEGNVIRLQFGAVNYLSEVWLNDEVVGFHEGGFTPFEFRVDEMIKTGKANVLTLRVVGPIILSDKEVDGVKPLETPQWRGGITGGIWQEVQLVATNETYIDDVFIQPNINDNTANIQVVLDQTAVKGASVDVEMSINEVGEGNKKVAERIESRKLNPGKNDIKWIIKIPDAKYWSPDRPQLYEAVVKVVNGGVESDQSKVRFGMRELTIKDKDFYLNGKRIYIKATFFEGLYPNGVAYPDSEEMARKEIQLAKEAGFNMIRPWRRPPVPGWLDLADEMGVLVVGSPALECMRLPLSTPYLPERVKNEIEQSILRDRNRACVVQWELFNELHRPVLKQLMRPMAMVARDLDPTRLILDESGGWAFGANMYLPNEYEPTQFNDIHNYPGPFIEQDRYDGYLSIGMTKEQKKAKGYKGATPGRNVVPGLMSFVSELGYGSLPDLTLNNSLFEEKGNALTPAYRYHKRLHEEQREILDQSGFGKMYPDMKQFYLDQQAIHGAANKRMIEAVRANPDVDGYCIHALAAGDWIMGAGLIDLWRNKKSYAYEGTKSANQPRIISIRTKPRNLYDVSFLNLEIIGVNELEDVNAKMQIVIISKSGVEFLNKELEIQWKSGVSTLHDNRIYTKGLNESFDVNVRLLSEDNQVLTENAQEFEVFSKPNIPESKVAVLESNGKLKAFLKQSGIDVVDFSKSTRSSIPVLVGSVDPKSDKDMSQALMKFIKSGGVAINLDATKVRGQYENPILPISAKAHPARGLWTCIPHLIHDHPIFDGLPSNMMMGNTYENIWPSTTLRELTFDGVQKKESVVASIGFDWFSEDHKMHYSGPGESWWGSDLAIAPLGKGRVIISQFRLIENLGKDPVADKMLFNMIRFATKK